MRVFNEEILEYTYMVCFFIGFTKLCLFKLPQKAKPVHHGGEGSLQVMESGKKLLVNIDGVFLVT